MKTKSLLVLFFAFLLATCEKIDFEFINEDAATFTEISSFDVGEAGAAEISAFDPSTNKLFVVTNSGSVTKIDVLDLSNPSAPVPIGFIDISSYGGGVNSVDVSDGKVAAAVEGFVKTDPGSVVVFKTTDYSLVKKVAVGALPDMIVYSHDGKHILTANEGEPNDAYTIDPLGTVSIISIKDDYVVTTLDFGSFAPQVNALKAKGFRLFGPGASIAQDVEPEYITISWDSKTAWVTLQENNAIAKIDIRSKRITHIFPLGFKNYNVDASGVDPSDRDGVTLHGAWPVKGMYEPDAIAVFEANGFPYLFTANEGDQREWAGFNEVRRVKDISLDATAFPDATIKTDPKLGRLNITTTLGDTDNDGDFDELYSFGARSFSVWNGHSGNLVFDSKKELELNAIGISKYDDGRSDDKGVEAEGMALGWVGKKPIAFVGMERADAVALYDISNPANPKFIKIMPTGDAPEGLLFIPAKESPTKKSLLVVSSEGDGTIKVYQTN